MFGLVGVEYVVMWVDCYESGDNSEGYCEDGNFYYCEDGCEYESGWRECS